MILSANTSILWYISLNHAFLMTLYLKCLRFVSLVVFFFNFQYYLVYVVCAVMPWSHKQQTIDCDRNAIKVL